MTELELKKIFFSLKIVFGEKEARKIFIKLARILFD